MHFEDNTPDFFDDNDNDNTSENLNMYADEYDSLANSIESYSKRKNKNKNSSNTNTDTSKSIFKTQRVNKQGKKVPVVFYGSNCNPGSKIRNAADGLYYPHYKVGSLDEDLFFKVTMATGEHGQTPQTLFYSFPEEFERHFYVAVSDNMKKDWYEKQEMLTRLRKQKGVDENIGKYHVVK
jgi:Fe-S cluster biosynthesis and repair protein YggX